MAHTHEAEFSPGLVSGRVEGLSVPDLLWAICRRRKTGTLRLTRDDVTKTVYIEDGRIIFAASENPDDRLGELLLRKSWISLDQLEEALARQGSGKRLGTLLVEAGHLGPERLVDGVLTQVREIVLGLFPWEWGEYRFEEGELPTREVITLGMKTGEILLQGIRRIRSFGRIRRSVGPGRTYYRLAPSSPDVLEGMRLPEPEAAVRERLERSPASVEVLCEEVLLSNFEIYQALWALRVLGVVEESERPFVDTDGAAIEGVLDARGVAHVLFDLCRSGETGVLHLTDGSRERSIHLKEGDCVFATSNDFEDGLLAHLLRRGVISLRDRDETAKRLLSNKRVGTILRELGVIDEHDLRSMVREQLSEIIYQAIGWSQGEFTFVPGELPTIEEITLDTSIESLVAVGLRRIDSWSRVRHGCGGLDARVALTPCYLQVLDRINVDTEEWGVISKLSEPRTVRQVCRDSALGDFSVCQILWTLKTLGALEEAPAVAEVAAPAEAQAETADPADDEPVAAPQEQSALPGDDGGDQPGFISREAIESIFASENETGESTVPASPAEDATTFIPREEVEAALGGPAAPDFSVSADADATDTDLPAAASPATTDEPAEPDDWQAPPEVDERIARFNRRQRVLYRTIRAELGAGAANFVRSCAERIGPDGQDPFARAELRNDGSWNVGDLRRLARHAADPEGDYERLIEVEIETLREHIGESRALALKNALEQVDGSPATAQTARPPE